VRAATLGAAGAAAGRPPLDGASVNGAPVTADAEFPLVEGDAVAFGAT
jgi:hypothetical protein